MQPYFLPYAGYFQLINAVDKFVIYDNIQFTKKGWINRNRILQNGKDLLISIPLKKASDYLDVCHREISESYDRTKLLNRFRESYRKAGYFDEGYPLVEKIILNDDVNLFEYIYRSVLLITDHLEVSTPILKSSELALDHSQKGQDRVISICKELNADEYLNPIGGQVIYNASDFLNAGIKLEFLKSEAIEYTQFTHDFIPNLSMIDVIMFNGKERTRTLLSQFSVI